MGDSDDSGEDSDFYLLEDDVDFGKEIEDTILRLLDNIDEKDDGKATKKGKNNKSTNNAPSGSGAASSTSSTSIMILPCGCGDKNKTKT